MNGERLRVSLVSEPKDAFVVTELPYNFEQYARTGEHLIHELYGKVAGIRMNGSAALGWKLLSVSGISLRLHSWCWKPAVR